MHRVNFLPCLRERASEGASVLAPQTMNLTTPDTMPTSTRLKRVAKWFAVTLGAIVVLIGLVLGAFSIAMARMPQYRAQMQSWLSERAKLNIQFATLQARWRWFGPELVFTEAVVRNADGSRTLIIAQRGGVGFDLWAALRTGRLNAGRFSLSGTELKAVRRPNGKFEIIGLAGFQARQSALDIVGLDAGNDLLRIILGVGPDELLQTGAQTLIAGLTVIGQRDAADIQLRVIDAHQHVFAGNRGLRLGACHRRQHDRRRQPRDRSLPHVRLPSVVVSKFTTF